MLNSPAAEWFFLDTQERALVTAVFALVDAPTLAPHDLLHENLVLLRRLAEAVLASPSLAALRQNVTRANAGEALIDLLCRTPDYDFDLNIPTRAVVGQAYLVAKINFFKSLRYALDGREAPPELRERLAAEIGQSIYSKMAEEIYISILTDPAGQRAVKVAAGRFLFRIWEDRLHIEIDDFAPLLESAWQARHRVQPRLGTMLGTEELVRLFLEARDDRFLDYFGRDALPDEQLQAFEEFLFGLSHEDIDRLRDLMTAHGRGVVSADEACGLLGLAADRWSRENHGPQGLYSSYKERKIRANYRGLTGTRGPTKTAEEYMLTAFLAKLPPE